MLQSYQAIYVHGHLTWLTDKPSIEEAPVIVTLMSAEEDPVLKVKHQPFPRIAGQGEILGDITRQLRLKTPTELWFPVIPCLD